MPHRDAGKQKGQRSVQGHILDKLSTFKATNKDTIIQGIVSSNISLVRPGT